MLVPVGVLMSEEVKPLRKGWARSMPALRSPFLFLGLLTSCPSQGLRLVCLDRNRTRQGAACSVGKGVCQLQAVPARLALLTLVPSVVGDPQVVYFQMLNAYCVGASSPSGFCLHSCLPSLGDRRQKGLWLWTLPGS